MRLEACDLLRRGGFHEGAKENAVVPNAAAVVAMGLYQRDRIGIVNGQDRQSLLETVELGTTTYVAKIAYGSGCEFDVVLQRWLLGPLVGGPMDTAGITPQSPAPRPCKPALLGSALDLSEY